MDDQQTKPVNQEQKGTRRAKLLLWLLVAGVLAIGCADLYLYFSFSLPVGTGSAGPSVDRVAFSKPWTSRPVLLVGLGDSVTAGFGARRGYSYFDRLVSNPADEFADMKGINLSGVFPGLKTTNLSVSGSTSFEVPAAQLPQLPAADAKTLGWVVITTGGNDLIHNYGRTPPREQAMYGASWEMAEPGSRNLRSALKPLSQVSLNGFPEGVTFSWPTSMIPRMGQGTFNARGFQPGLTA